jgi:uncharacterized membrane protein
MSNHSAADPQLPDPSQNPANQPTPASHGVWPRVRTRLVEGLLVIFPILITIWIIYWLYSTLEKYVLDPLAGFVLWKAQIIKGQKDLPEWFENYAAPIISIFLAFIIVYCCGVLAHSRIRRQFDRLVLRVPVISHVYDAVRTVFQSLENTNQQSAPQRIVLVPFPHPGMRLPAIVTSSCRDVTTEKTVLCVYVPTTPIPTSGFFLMIPEDEVTELNWGVQQTLQAIITGGLVAPRDVTYYSSLASSVLPGSLSHSKPITPQTGSGTN